MGRATLASRSTRTSLVCRIQGQLKWESMRIIVDLVPKSLVLRGYALLERRGGEPELRLIPTLCHTTKASVDIGASRSIQRM
jgi:hypothetical protein